MGKTKKLLWHNIVIITEDAKSGLQLLRKINSEVYHSKYFITSTADSNDKNSAGATKFQEKTEELIKADIIRSGTIVYFGIDNIIETNVQVKRNYKKEDVKREAARIAYIHKAAEICYTRIVTDTKAYMIKSTYASMEESVLSYKHLDSITEPFGRPQTLDNYESKLLELYRNISPEDKAILKGDNQPDNNFYMRIFSDFAVEHNKTLEQVLSELLNIITKLNKSAKFEIRKSEIGICWIGNCKTVREQYRVNCDYCRLGKISDKEISISGENKLYNLIQNSRLKHIFNSVNQCRQSLIKEENERKKTAPVHNSSNKKQ